LAALSKQSTARVLKSTRNLTQVQIIAKKAASFLERRVTASAWNQLNGYTSFFALKLPFWLDPADKSPVGFFAIFVAFLLAHKKLFKLAKEFQLNNAEALQGVLGHSKLVLFLVKQTSRFAIILFLLTRFLFGAPPDDGEGTPGFLSPTPATPQLDLVFSPETPAAFAAGGELDPDDSLVL
jgi:hypothetical protein